MQPDKRNAEAAVGADRTHAPARLMARLDALHNAAEFEAAVARAAIGEGI